jgi:hypothetical protein
VNFDEKLKLNLDIINNNIKNNLDFNTYDKFKIFMDTIDNLVFAKFFGTINEIIKKNKLNLYRFIKNEVPKRLREKYGIPEGTIISYKYLEVQNKEIDEEEAKFEKKLEEIEIYEEFFYTRLVKEDFELIKKQFLKNDKNSVYKFILIALLAIPIAEVDYENSLKNLLDESEIINGIAQLQKFMMNQVRTTLTRKFENLVKVREVTVFTSIEIKQEAGNKRGRPPKKKFKLRYKSGNLKYKLLDQLIEKLEEDQRSKKDYTDRIENILTIYNMLTDITRELLLEELNNITSDENNRIEIINKLINNYINNNFQQTEELKNIIKNKMDKVNSLNSEIEGKYVKQKETIIKNYKKNKEDLRRNIELMKKERKQRRKRIKFFVLKNQEHDVKIQEFESRRKKIIYNIKKLKDNYPIIYQHNQFFLKFIEKYDKRINRLKNRNKIKTKLDIINRDFLKKEFNIHNIDNEVTRVIINKQNNNDNNNTDLKKEQVNDSEESLLMEKDQIDEESEYSRFMKFLNGEDEYDDFNNKKIKNQKEIKQENINKCKYNKKNKKPERN